MVVRPIDRPTLTALYPGGGSPAYDPQTMPKAILLAHAPGICSGREIARAARESVGFPWACGMGPLGHSTVNRLRTGRIRPAFEEAFSGFVSPLADMGLATLGTHFPGGTKTEADANKSSFAWARPDRRYQEQPKARAHAHLQAMDDMGEEEGRPAPEGPSGMDPGAIAEAARRVDERIGKEGAGRRPGDGEGKALGHARRMCEGEWAERVARYEEDAETPGGRGSFSKTGPGATFMRVKDDCMGDGQPKAAYNVRAGAEGQFVIDCTCRQGPADAACATGHPGHAEKAMGRLPGEVVADAGCGSEQNCRWLDERGATACVRRSELSRGSRNGKWREDPMRPANRRCDDALGAFECPGGRTLGFRRPSRRKTGLGCASETRVCGCGSCAGRALRDPCLRPKGPGAARTVAVSPTLRRLRGRASFLLNAERGTKLRKRRSVGVETIFGDIERNWHFERSLLRGLEKADHEFRLVAMGHDLRRLALALAVWEGLLSPFKKKDPPPRISILDGGSGDQELLIQPLFRGSSLSRLSCLRRSPLATHSCPNL
jgi:transposase